MKILYFILIFNKYYYLITFHKQIFPNYIFFLYSSRIFYSNFHFPVINEDNHLVGMITTDAVVKKGKMEIENKKVEDLMIPVSEIIVMGAEREVNDALKQLFRKNMSRIFIVNNQSQLLGLVSKTDILNLAQERGEFLRTTKKWNY